MLHHRRQRDRERLRQLAHRQIAALVELREQRAARGVGERREGAVEPAFPGSVGLLILNH